MADPRAALSVLVTAFERHLEASAQRRGEDDPAVVAAYDDLADAFEAYDDALLDAFGEMTPLEVVAEPDSSGLDDEGDDDQRYLGLDDEEFDEIGGDDDLDDDGDDLDDEDDEDDDDLDDDDDDLDDDEDDLDDDEDPEAHPS